MTINELIEMLRKRIAHMTMTRAQAAQLGDVARVAALDTEISETEATLAQLESLS